MTNKHNIIISVLAVIAVIAIGAAVSFGTQLQDLKKQTASAGTLSESEIESIVKDVGQFIDLPSDEAPTIATVTDASVLKSQPFFAKAETGDMVLIYANSGKAVLWRPSTKKIIEVSTVNLPPAPTSAPTQTSDASDEE